MFKIGHPAYTGPNSLAQAGTKSEALAILRAKGVKRDAARAALTLVSARDFGSIIVLGGPSGSNPIEINLQTPAVTRLDGPTARQIINRNAKVALAIFNRFKNAGCRLSPSWLATEILHRKMGGAA